MSVNVLVIAEDFRKDQYVLGPIIEQMMQAIGIRAKVRICTDPLLGGPGEALTWDCLAEIIERYRGMVRLFLLVVNRDCDDSREAGLRTMEQQAAAMLASTDRVFLAQSAWQAMEVWPLAGVQDLPEIWHWKEVRADCRPRKNYYDEYARERGLFESPYEGRALLAREAAQSYRRIRRLCPEDVAALEDRIRQALR